MSEGGIFRLSRFSANTNIRVARNIEMDITSCDATSTLSGDHSLNSVSRLARDFIVLGADTIPDSPPEQTKMVLATIVAFGAVLW